MILGAMPAMMGSGVEPPEVTYLNNDNRTIDHSSTNFLYVDFGSAESGEFIVVGLMIGKPTYFYPDPVDMTIGGVTATKLDGSNFNDPGNIQTALFIANVGSATGGHIQISYGTTVNETGISVFRAKLPNGSTPYDTSYYGSSGTTNISTIKKGAVIGVSCTVNEIGNSWTTGFTKNHDYDIRSTDYFSSAHWNDYPATETTGLGVSEAASTTIAIWE